MTDVSDTGASYPTPPQVRPDTVWPRLVLQAALHVARAQGAAEPKGSNELHFTGGVRLGYVREVFCHMPCDTGIEIFYKIFMQYFSFSNIYG